MDFSTLIINLHTAIWEKYFKYFSVSFQNDDYYESLVAGETSLGKVPCPFCEKTFQTKKSVTRHMQIHTGQYEFLCQICQKGFSMKFRLKEHMMKHEGRKFYCDLCGKGFTTRAVLNVHKRQHHGASGFK